MKFYTLLLSVAYLAIGFEAVNSKFTTERQHGKTSTVSMPAIKPTTAPLITSTTAPTKAPKVQVAPTKSVTTKTNAKSHSVTKKSSSKSAEKKDEMKHTEKTEMEKEMQIEVLPIEKPVTVDHPLQAEESKSLAVIGFITKDGIYEIENQTGNGIGKIQSRQAEEEGQHICNYGAVVIYSDVPCEQLTNVKITEVGDKPAFDQAPAKPENKPDKNNGNKESEDKEDLDTQKKPARRRVSSKRRNKYKKTKLQQQQKGNKKRRNGQNRPNKNNRRRLQQKRRRQQQNNRRDWELEEYDDEYDDERQFQNQRKRNQRKGQRRQQAERFTSDYDY